MIELKIYVPVPGTWPHRIIRPGSGIVGTTDSYNDRIMIDFQEILGANSNIKTWEDAVFHAAGRHVTRYPTIARMWPEKKDLIEIGIFTCNADWSNTTWAVTNGDAYKTWTIPDEGASSIRRRR